MLNSNSTEIAFTGHTGKVPFHMGSVEETMQDWIEKIEALSNVVAQLAWDANNKESMALQWYGEVIGNVLSDYSAALNKLVTEKVLPVYRAGSNCAMAAPG